MRDPLAERLLAKVMEWQAPDVARERPGLQAMAAYKYDEYQQFSPGMRFVESLALWLNQFHSIEEKRFAYNFIKSKLVFYSTAEMNHFVSIAYPDLIRPILLRRTAEEAGYNPWHLGKVANSTAFQLMQRQTLFLGLSDGARTDVFRRSNPELSHEQFWQTYELPDERASDLQVELAKYIELSHQKNHIAVPKFRTVVLLDDFSASGFSYIRLEGKQSKGKIGTFAKSLVNKKSAIHKLLDANDLHVIVLLYVATKGAYEHIDSICRKMWEPAGVKHYTLAVHTISDLVRIRDVSENPIRPLIQDYYDHSVYDRHMEKGGTPDARYGFAACGLPVVLSHNSPNNSIALLWSFETCKVRGLFPRVSRHKATP